MSCRKLQPIKKRTNMPLFSNNDFRFYRLLGGYVIEHPYLSGAQLQSGFQILGVEHVRIIIQIGKSSDTMQMDLDPDQIQKRVSYPLFFGLENSDIWKIGYPLICLYCITCMHHQLERWDTRPSVICFNEHIKTTLDPWNTAKMMFLIQYGCSFYRLRA